VRNLVNVVSRGGNFLLNVGPTSQGVFPPEAIERLQYIGTWLKTNCAAIYGSTYTPLQKQSWGETTSKEDRLFLQIYNWPENGKIEIEVFPGLARNISLISGESLNFKQSGKLLEISLPKQPSDPDVSVLVVEIDNTEKGWADYSAPIATTTSLGKYIKTQMIASAVINAIINGLIAFFSYRTRTGIPFTEAAVDVPITVFILVFLVVWLTVDSVRKEFILGNLLGPLSSRQFLRLPKGAALRALIMAIVCAIVWGALLDGILFLIAPNGFASWQYIITKTIYTGLTAALASFLTIISVTFEEKRK
jgi:hypothetical protein